MATLTVRNLDDALVRALRIRAAEHGRSAEAEHRALLHQALAQPATAPAAAERLAAFRSRIADRGSAAAADLLEESRAARSDALAGGAGG